jgi:hypothetical protein
MAVCMRCGKKFAECGCSTIHQVEDPPMASKQSAVERAAARVLYMWCDRCPQRRSCAQGMLVPDACPNWTGGVLASLMPALRRAVLAARKAKARRET